MSVITITMDEQEDLAIYLAYHIINGNPVTTFKDFATAIDDLIAEWEMSCKHGGHRQMALDDLPEEGD